jgi:polyribonucleotide nucleotidyltransferase
MATVCGGSLALMDAGVPIKSHVAGLSVGLVTENNSSDYMSDVGKYALLTDILGMEDHYGDMDFKVAGTLNGITGVQLDVKLPGVPVSVLGEAVYRALDGRTKVLEVMNACIPKPLKIKASAMAVRKLPLKESQRSLIVGPGGITMRRIEGSTGAVISFPPKDEVYSPCFHDSEPLLTPLYYLLNTRKISLRLQRTTMFSFMHPLRTRLRKLRSRSKT